MTRLVDSTRLDASPEATAEPGRPGLGHPCACLECGGPYVPRQVGAEFCSTACRKAWNNRRALRGAELLDLAMAWRFERRVANGLRILTAISRLIAGFRRQDIVERAGRRSWTPPAAVIARKPYLRAEQLVQGRGRP